MESAVKFEERKESRIQFLDLELKLSLYLECWKYNPKAQAEVLPYDSAHSKLAKRGIALPCMIAALTKLCAHSASSSFERQVTSLEASGYPMILLISVRHFLHTQCLII